MSFLYGKLGRWSANSEGIFDASLCTRTVTADADRILGGSIVYAMIGSSISASLSTFGYPQVHVAETHLFPRSWSWYSRCW